MAREIHEHVDAKGKVTGKTVVYRESMWDDDSRDRALALTMYEDGVCSCGCGTPVDKAYDPAQKFKTNLAICYAGRAIAQRERAEREKHKDDPEGWDAGHHWYATPTEKVDVSQPQETRLEKARRLRRERGN